MNTYIFSVNNRDRFLSSTAGTTTKRTSSRMPKTGCWRGIKALMTMALTQLSVSRRLSALYASLPRHVWQPEQYLQDDNIIWGLWKWCGLCSRGVLASSDSEYVSVCTLWVSSVVSSHWGVTLDELVPNNFHF